MALALESAVQLVLIAQTKGKKMQSSHFAPPDSRARCAGARRDEQVLVVVGVECSESRMAEIEFLL